MMSDTRFLRTGEAAAFCGLSPRTLEKLRLTGDGPRYVSPPGHRFVRYERADLEAWLRAGSEADLPTTDAA